MMERLAAFVAVISVSGVSRYFLAPSVCAAVALTTARTQEEIFGVLGAWFLGLVLAGFARAD